MPNHLHGIIIVNVLVGATRWVAREKQIAQEKQIQHTKAIHRIAPTFLKSRTIGAIVGQFKSIVTKHINRYRNTSGTPVWQRNYYDHIIRNEKSLSRIQEYIVNNPFKWGEDIENPLNGGNKNIRDYYDRIY
jgi:REP element-mobilizing transposase RayT